MYTEEKLKFACPYFKRNPKKYWQRPCQGPGWDSIARVKYVGPFNHPNIYIG